MQTIYPVIDIPTQYIHNTLCLSGIINKAQNPSKKNLGYDTAYSCVIYFLQPAVFQRHQRHFLKNMDVER